MSKIKEGFRLFTTFDRFNYFSFFNYTQKASADPIYQDEEVQRFSLLTKSSYLDDRSIRFIVLKRKGTFASNSEIFGRSLIGAGFTYDKFYIDLLFVHITFS